LEQVWTTLATIDQFGGSTMLPALADERDRSKSTVGRHLDQLAAAGAVTTARRGKTRHVTRHLLTEPENPDDFTHH